VVVKLGGSALEPDCGDALKALLEREIPRSRLVLVHGGSPEIALLYQLAGLPEQMVDGLRVTTPSGAELVAAALSGLVAPRLLRALDRAGVRGVALSGLDAGMLRAAYLDRERYGQVGDAPRVAPEALLRLLDDGLLPVVAPLALGPDAEIMNVNGDVAAAAIARALGAQRIDLVTTGPLRNARGEPFAAIPVRRIRELIDQGVARDGMIPKLRAAHFALDAGDRSARGRGAAVPVARIGGFSDFARGRATRIESARAPRDAAPTEAAGPLRGTA
jgi:acetylglutamate kinase